MKKKYFISIITVCYNAEDCIDRTIKSVLSQKYDSFEYIVIDGASTDSTISIIQLYGDRIHNIISEPDNGIYYAMNKGMQKANGQYLYFLNAGDVFIHDHVLHHIGNELVKSNVKLLFGKGFHYSTDTGKIGLIDYSSFKINKYFLYRASICQQSFFAHHALFGEFGGFDTSYKIKADHEWVSRCIIKHQIPIQQVDIGIVIYEDGGFSTTQYDQYGEKEKLRIKETYYTSIFDKILLKRQLLWFARRFLY